METIISHEDTRQTVQTPVKKAKNKLEIQPLTAESEEPERKTIENIEPAELFQHFDTHVQIIEDQFEELTFAQEEIIERKLNYEDSPKSKKLNFDYKSASMKKKHHKVEIRECPETHPNAINLFKISVEGEGDSQDNHTKDMNEHNLEKTPEKHDRKNEEWLKTARKENGFRNIY